MRLFIKVIFTTSFLLYFLCEIIFAKSVSNQNRIFENLINACAKGDLITVNRLLEKGIDPVGTGENINQPMYWAISKNYPKIVFALLKAKVDPNFDWGEQGGTFLTNACQFGYIDVVKVLIKNGAKVNLNRKNGFSALYMAIIYKKDNVISFLIDKGAKLNDRDSLALSQLGWFKMEENKSIIKKMNEVR